MIPFSVKSESLAAGKLRIVFGLILNRGNPFCVCVVADQRMILTGTGDSLSL